MSNYPDGMRGSYQTEIEMHCTECGHRWDIAATYDLGTVEANDGDDKQCPECGSWETE